MSIVTSEFPGAAFPPGTEVSFTTKTGALHGTVQQLLPRRARVATRREGLWNVSYGAMRRLAPAPAPAMSLREVEALGARLIRKHEVENGLKKGWKFGFDLARVRGRRMQVRGEANLAFGDVLLEGIQRGDCWTRFCHEIAHAIAGPTHRHDDTWKTVARRIGCTANRCHQVDHTPPRWQGHCGCGQEWKRQRLTRRARTGYCPKCKKRIAWEQVGRNAVIRDPY